MNDLDLDQYYLRSERGIDYRLLREFLEAHDWKAADIETMNIVYQCLGSSDFQSASFVDFPCTDLISMDRLWMAHSQKQFGFSIQVQFYLRCLQAYVGSQRKMDLKSTFLNGLNWSIGGVPLNPDKISYNTNIPRGHLPSVLLRLHQMHGNGFTDFVHRLFSCSVTPPGLKIPPASQD